MHEDNGAEVIGAFAFSEMDEDWQCSSIRGVQRAASLHSAKASTAA
jgi:hypothetical protein